MQYVKGDILTQDGFKKGYLGFEGYKVVELSKRSPPEKPVAQGFIVPTFVNAHTHIGDSFVRRKNIELPRNAEELVAPPNGLKHRLLRKASEKEIIDGMKSSVNEMIEAGTSHFCDFREDGIDGVYQLQNALKNKKINSMVLSRPWQMRYDKKELELLLKNSDGIGLSSISDWEYSEIEKITKHAKHEKKIFALHASEAVREDIDLILDLKPDFLVHMVSATESDLARVKEENTPVIICPRSNAFFNLKTNLKLMKKTGIDLMLGTDNAMLNVPNVLEELIYLKNSTSAFSTQELLNMITYTPRKALNLDDCIHGPTSYGNFVVLNRGSLELVYIFKKNKR
ncbi:MAG: amidohydrolase family protein [Thermoplasmatales archaeon]|nr:MAG: amidohydrolase family protein [Thermoplasmatales archaeon]